VRAADGGFDPTARIARVKATERIVGDTLYVCPVGWATDVYELTGAIAVVWDVLDRPRTIAELAHECAVRVDDDLLASSVADLFDRGLARVAVDA
jgi:hypothetical protein